jgi:hypothetical protein
MPLQSTSGAASYDAFGGGAAAEPNYIESCFSTYLYTGVGSAITITNGIDLAGDGGLVWLKNRGTVSNNSLHDTTRTPSYQLVSNSTAAQDTVNGDLSSFNSNGFSLGTSGGGNNITGNIASWTFRKQPKFFDVVTYTGTGSNQSIAHNLGSAPGCIIVKTLGSGYDWNTWHRSGTQLNSYSLALNSTRAYQNTGDDLWGTVGGVPNMNSATFSVGSYGAVNASGQTYVAYLFAHDAGGFGLTGTDNVISCGSFTTDGSGVPPNVNLGYEPQWIMCKGSSAGAAGFGWTIQDNMRGSTANGAVQYLRANSSGAENADTGQLAINSTGFGGGSGFGASNTFIYIAIRRGPMEVPTSGAEVFSPVGFNSSASNQTINTNIVTDLCLYNFRNITNGFMWFDRLRGITGTTGSGNKMLLSPSAAAEANDTSINGAGQTTLVAGGTLGGYTQILECFRRAPGFFDVVCYTGNGTGSTQITHNLGVAPTLVIVKQRSGSPDRSWWVLTTAVPQLNILNDTSAANAYGVPANLFGDSTYNNYIAPTATTLTLSPSSEVNNSGSTYVAYLFATLAGVSKVGSYTGNGSSQTINCGFTGGARFVLIKRTNSTGDWYVWDSARGIVAGNDPHLSLNTTAAEVTTDDSVDTDSTGFVVNQVAATNVNVNTATYIFLAIA